MAIGLGLAPVGRLLRHHLQVRIVVDDVVIALGADAGIGVGFLADQLDVIAFLAHQLDELLRAELGALVVVGDDLRDGDAGGVDLAIDQERRNARVLGLLHGGDRGVGAGIVEDDRLGAAADRRVDQLGLLVGVVVMNQNQRFIAEFLGLGFRADGFGLEEWVVVRGRDDGNEIRRIGGCGGAQRQHAGKSRKCHSASEFHDFLPFEKACASAAQAEMHSSLSGGSRPVSRIGSFAGSPGRIIRFGSVLSLPSTCRLPIFSPASAGQSHSNS